MEVRFPYQIFYEVPADVPVADAIESLLGAERLLLDIGPLLERLIPELEVQVRVYVREVSQHSLREVLLTALFITYQKDLEKEVPDLVNKLFGADLSEHRTITAILFMVLLYYGAEFVYKLVNKTTEHSRLRHELDGLAHEVAQKFNVTEDRVKQILEERYSSRPRINLLGKAALRVFAPSKRQNNSAMAIENRRIEPRIIEEVPSDARALEMDEPPDMEPVENVRIELHAQDVDRAKTGWAAIIPEVSPNRLRMQIYPPLKPEDIYTKTEVVGDVILVSRRNESGNMEPYMFHLVRVH
jgi:hypothetical protein